MTLLDDFHTDQKSKNSITVVNVFLILQLLSLVIGNVIAFFSKNIILYVIITIVLTSIVLITLSTIYKVKLAQNFGVYSLSFIAFFVLLIYLYDVGPSRAKKLMWFPTLINIPLAIVWMVSIYKYLTNKE